MFDTEKLITEVEKRPALYNVKLKEYSNRDIKTKLWEEVAIAMYSDWSELTLQEKNDREKELQTKWKSLRDQFRKEYRSLKNVKSGQSAPKKKKYLYFDQLLFLTTFIESRHTVSNVTNINQEQENKLDVVTPNQQETASVAATPTITKKTRLNRTELFEREEIKKITNVLTESVALQREKKLSDKFGNKAFFMSLLPLMDKLPEDIMLQCRVQIMQVLQQSREHQTASALKEHYPVQTLQSPPLICSSSPRPSTSASNASCDWQTGDRLDCQQENSEISLLDLYPL